MTMRKMNKIFLTSLNDLMGGNDHELPLQDFSRTGFTPNSACEVIKRLPPNDLPVPESPLPFTEDEGRQLCALADKSYRSVPMEKWRLEIILRDRILPAFEYLMFLGIEKLPEIQVLAPWANGHLDVMYPAAPIRYPDFVPPDDTTMEELEELMDIALENAMDGEIPCTLGRIGLNAFGALFCTTVAMINNSPTAHRRYKDEFVGQRIRLIFHAEYDHVEMFADADLVEAMNESVKHYLRGR
ncbi:MAG: hypothetical protein ACYCS8_05815 [Acidithiobacillus sp.]